LAKKARVYDGTAWQELASAQTDLTAYSTTAQMNTAITAGVGLVPILTQTIGTAVSSVVVSNAFSATYDNYKITCTGGTASTSNTLKMTLGASTANYYGNLIYARPNNTSVLSAANNNAASWEYAGIGTSAGFAFQMELTAPFLSYRTSIFSGTPEFSSAGVNGFYVGWHDVATSYTGFTLTTNTGTLTGGTIRVYGYKN
jgi:hypothetical protein